MGVIGALVLAPVLAAVGADIDWVALGAGVVCVAGGHAIGSRAFARLPGEHYEPLVLGVVGAAGVASVVGGLL
jgi:hypothetical protein